MRSTTAASISYVVISTVVMAFVGVFVDVPYGLFGHVAYSFLFILMTKQAAQLFAELMKVANYSAYGLKADIDMTHWYNFPVIGPLIASIMGETPVADLDEGEDIVPWLAEIVAFITYTIYVLGFAHFVFGYCSYEYAASLFIVFVYVIFHPLLLVGR